MLLWLPFSGGSALAASLAMQLQHGCCPEQAVSMSHDDMAGHGMMHHDQEAMQAQDTDDSGNASCGVCHLACAGYMSMPGFKLSALAVTVRETTPYLDDFTSATSTPLLPPPVSRA